MFIVVAINAEQFPVTAILGIVIMVVVAMMYREFLDVRAGKFPTATSTDPWVHFQRLLAITLLPLGGTAIGLGNDPVQALAVN